MGKLMKYEFRKQLMSKIVILAVGAVLEILFALGLFLEKEKWLATATGLLSVLAFIGLFYLSFESVVTFSNDLKTKQSYMLFLTPRNMFQVVGAKIVVTIIQIFGAGLVFAMVAIGDVALVCSKYGKIQEFLDVVKAFVKNLTGVEIRLKEIIYVFLMVLITWLLVVTMAMFAITLSTTLFANKKYKGLISVLIFFALEYIIGKIATLTVPTGFLQGEYLVVGAEAWAYIGVYAAALVLNFVGTALLLEKKVSV